MNICVPYISCSGRLFYIFDCPYGMILDTIERMKAEQPSPYGFKGTDQTIKKYIYNFLKLAISQNNFNKKPGIIWLKITTKTIIFQIHSHLQIESCKINLIIFEVNIQVFDIHSEKRFGLYPSLKKNKIYFLIVCCKTTHYIEVHTYNTCRYNILRVGFSNHHHRNRKTLVL